MIKIKLLVFFIISLSTLFAQAQQSDIELDPQGNASGDIVGIKVTETGNNTTKFHVYRNFTGETNDVDLFTIDHSGNAQISGNSSLLWDPLGNASGDKIGFKVTETGNNTTKFHIYRNFTGDANDVDRLVIDNVGNVGIGITSPNSNGGTAAKVLHINNPTDAWAVTHYTNTSTGSLAGDGMVVGSIGENGYIFNYEAGALLLGTNSTTRMKVDSDGNVGIGTNDPEGKLSVDINKWGTELNTLDLRNSASASTTDASFSIKFGRIFNDRYFNFLYNTTNYGILGESTQLLINRGDNGANLLSINGNGNIGIGTINPGLYRLAVEGKIGAHEIVVTTDGWSDFVFDNDYKLKDLEEVENFIEENNHLPDIPSEKDVLENGIQLGAMDAKLLQKIEELTLYMIEMNKDVKALKNENELLKKEINTLKTQ